ncbi:MAG TPA: hypothetical protein VER08_03625 [Pyrinomonadaceae bacterium]|nr:hypothetical protein [Pyrinomonadaceae bacterium]
MSKTSTKESAKTSETADGGAALSTFDDGAEAAESRSGASRAAVPVPSPLVASQVTLGANLFQPGLNWFRAFVPTDSGSPIILGTLAETRGTGHATLFCGARNYNGRYGVLLTVFVIGQPSVAAPAVVVTLLQAGARQYGQPIPYVGG